MSELLKLLFEPVRVINAGNLNVPQGEFKQIKPLFEAAGFVKAQVRGLPAKFNVDFPVFDIVQFDGQNGNVLRKKSLSVLDPWFRSPAFSYFVQVLLATVVLSKYIVGTPGVGISAVQVGVPISLFLALLSKTKTWELIINPTIEPMSGQQEKAKEGCLSVKKGNYQVEVPRYKKVKLKYRHIVEPGVKKLILKGFDARVAQHEYDHLHGKLIIDYE